MSWACCIALGLRRHPLRLKLSHRLVESALMPLRRGRGGGSGRSLPSWALWRWRLWQVPGCCGLRERRPGHRLRHRLQRRLRPPYHPLHPRRLLWSPHHQRNVRRLPRPPHHRRRDRRHHRRHHRRRPAPRAPRLRDRRPRRHRLRRPHPRRRGHLRRLCLRRPRQGRLCLLQRRPVVRPQAPRSRSFSGSTARASNWAPVAGRHAGGRQRA